MKEMDVSVFIPIYRESTHLADILNVLVSQEIEKEIFVLLDEPTEYSLRILKRFRTVKFVVNENRVGKAEALNKAVELSCGRILLFLDADIAIPSDSGFLERIVNMMSDTDLLDIKKEVINESFLSKMSYYEYVGFNIGSWLLSKVIKRCPAVNGAAFAIRKDVFDSLQGFRRVLSEDLDLALRAFVKNYKFDYTKEVKVYNYVHSTWQKWIVQRRRWAIGAALWLKEYCKDLVKISARRPQVYVPALFLLFPSLTLILSSFFVPDLFIHRLFSLLLIFLAVRFSFIIPVLILITLSINVFKSVLFTLTSFFTFSTLFFIFSKKLEFKFKIHEFFIYYFFYSLLSLLIMVTGILEVFILDKRTVSDWKV